MKRISIVAVFLISTTLMAQTPVNSDAQWLDLNKKTVDEFIEMLPLKEGSKPSIWIITVGTQADIGWVNDSDNEMLMELIDNRKMAFCIMQAISSYLPAGETSTIGGVAMDLIDSYRNNSKYPLGLTTCTENNKKRQKEIQKWYKEFKKKNGLAGPMNCSEL